MGRYNYGRSGEVYDKNTGKQVGQVQSGGRIADSKNNTMGYTSSYGYSSDTDTSSSSSYQSSSDFSSDDDGSWFSFFSPVLWFIRIILSFYLSIAIASVPMLILGTTNFIAQFVGIICWGITFIKIFKYIGILFHLREQ